MGLGLTVPELFVGGVETEVTEATLKDVLDTILCARALLHHLHPLLHRHSNVHRKNTEDKPPGSPKITTRVEPYYCIPVNQYILSLQ